MIGSKTFEIGPEEFVRGVTSSANLKDGGLSNETQHVNITAVPGVLYPPGAITDKSTNLTDEIIASCEDPGYLGKDRFFCAENGTLYSWNGTALTLEKTPTGDLVTQGTTDMVPWYDNANGTNIYITTKAGSGGEVMKWNKTSTLTEDWWTNTLGQSALQSTTAWRPLLVYERNLFIGDGYQVHRVDPLLTVSYGIVQLGNEETISAMGIDQGSGRMLIATSSGSNYSDASNRPTKIYVYDGFSNKPSRVVPVSGLVTSFKSVGNTTFIFYGNKLGYWTGSGIEYIRTLNFAKGDSSLLIYPHRACSIDNTLYWVDTSNQSSPINKQIMAFGETIDNTRAFYPVLYPPDAAGSITCLAPVSSTKLGFSYATSQFFTHDITSVAAVVNGGAQMLSKRYTFPRDVTFNGVIAEFDQNVGAVDADLISISCIDSNGTVNSPASFNPGTRSDIHFHEFTYPTVQTRSIQLRINYGGNGANIVGIRRLTVFYTPKE